MGDIYREQISAEGQVTLPEPLRAQLDLPPGSEVELERVSEGVLIRKPFVVDPERGRRTVELLRGKAKGGMTTDEIMELTRGPYNDLESEA